MISFYYWYEGGTYMKGLFKNNFLAVWTNAKIFLFFMLVMGIVVIIIPDQTWQMYFIIIGIVGIVSKCSYCYRK